MYAAAGERLPSSAESSDPAPLPQPLPHPLERMITAMRWIALAAMLLLTLLWQEPGRIGQPLWPFVLGMIVYNGVIEVLRWRVPGLRSYSWVAYADLPIAGLLYAMDAEPSGPLFIGFYIAVVTAAASLPLRTCVLYACAVVAAVAAVAPTLPLWTGSSDQVRTTTVRLLILALVGAGTATFAHRLVREEEVSLRMRRETSRLNELERLRRTFISTVSHELRTPLTASRAGLGMIAASAAGRLTADEQQLLENARRNIECLGVLIDDLLAYNQLDAGTLQLDLDYLDARSVVTESVAALRPLFAGVQQVVKVELDGALPVYGDRNRLDQVVTNLLANAHQHTPPGTHVTIGGRHTDGQVELWVRDSGPGIPADQLEQVFHRFHRLDTHGGSGLGLTIARGLTELHGGRVWAERPPDGGTLFRLTLPAAPPPAPLPVPRVSSSTPSSIGQLPTTSPRPTAARSVRH